MCDHRLWNEPDGLRCCVDDLHDTHQYESTSGIASVKHEDDGGE